MLRFGGPQKIRGRAKIGPRPFSLTCVLHIGFENVLSCQQDASIAHRFHTMREKHPQKFNSRYSFTLCVCVWFSCNSTVICLEQRFQMWGLGPHSGALSCCFKVTGTQINFLVFVLICSFVGKPVRKKKLRTDPWSLVFVRCLTHRHVVLGDSRCLQLRLFADRPRPFMKNKWKWKVKLFLLSSLQDEEQTVVFWICHFRNHLRFLQEAEWKSHDRGEWGGGAQNVGVGTDLVPSLWTDALTLLFRL